MPPTIPTSASPIKRPEMTLVDNRLPTCRNYWRFGSLPSPPQRPPSYLLKPHLIASSESSEGRNPNSKYYKLRHGPGSAQFSPLTDDMMSYHQYRVRLPFDPSPFRGVTRFAFWILFISILILLLILITALFRVEDLHDQHHPQSEAMESQLVNQETITLSHTDKGLRNSLIFNSLLNRIN